VVFLVAQPGSGKSRVARDIGATFEGGFVDVDSDRHKPFHPAYDRLMAEDDHAMAFHTGADGRRWAQMMHDHIREHRLNALVQSTAGNPASVVEDMRRYHAAGYRTAAAFLGVPEAMSQQGIVNRYYEQVQDRGRGRLTVPENARRSYVGVPALADRVDADRLVGEVAVFRRGEGEPRYHNQLGPGGEWERPPGLRAAIDAERARPWTPHETADHLAVQSQLGAGLGSEWTAKLAEIDRSRRTPA
jgi:predicted ABC-type ATPase